MVVTVLEGRGTRTLAVQPSLTPKQDAKVLQVKKMPFRFPSKQKAAGTEGLFSTGPQGKHDQEGKAKRA